MDLFTSLQRKIFLFTSIIIFVLVSLLSLIEYNRDRKHLYGQLLVHMKENAFSVRNSIESVRIPMLVQSILEEYSENILKHEDTTDKEKQYVLQFPPHEIHVVNSDRILMASTNTQLIGIPLEEAVQHEDEGLRNVLEGNVAHSINQMKHSGVRVLKVSVPIREDGRIIGALQYVEPYTKLEALVKESFSRHLLFALGMIISLTVFLNFFFSRMVTRPIKELSRAMDKIRIKGASEEIALSSKDEIGMLARSFNEMSRALKERNEEVTKYTTSLQEMVRERTKELEESHSQLIQTEKLASMGKLAGGVAHEINNPIGIIVSRTDCMLMDSAEQGFSGRLIKDLNVIKKHANRIASITRGILTFSRKAPAEFSLIDLNNLIDETLLLLGKELSTSNILIHKDADCDIPRIYGNGSQLQQVFLNLFINAKDAMPDGGSITIASRCDRGGMIHILISDTGNGIAPEDQDRIFEPFFSTKKEPTHTGLGLSITYGIIKDHRGDINVRSSRGEGTTFEILLPLESAQISEIEKR